MLSHDDLCALLDAIHTLQFHHANRLAGDVVYHQIRTEEYERLEALLLAEVQK